MIGKLLALGVIISSTTGLKCFLSSSSISLLRSNDNEYEGYDTKGLVGGGEKNVDVISFMRKPFNKAFFKHVDCEELYPGRATFCVTQQSSVDGAMNTLRACWDGLEEASLGCTTFDMGLGEQITRCFCDTDNCNDFNGGIRCITNNWVIIALFLVLFF